MKYKIFIALFYTSLCAAQTQHFIAPLGDGNWEIKTTRLECRITQTIPHYGEASISRRNAQSAKFTLNTWQGLNAPTTAKIYAIAPKWKHKAATEFIHHAKMQIGKKNILLDTDVTQRLMKKLAEGMTMRFIYHSQLGKVKVDLTSENFHKAYAAYIQCAGDLIPFPYSDVKDTTLFFNFNSKGLSLADRTRLKKIKEYVLADPKVLTVRIDGYTDNSGHRGHNNYLSEKRAKLVRDFLVAQGLTTKKVKTYWHGVNKPLAENDTPEGQAKNRRVTIKLIK